MRLKVAVVSSLLFFIPFLSSADTASKEPVKLNELDYFEHQGVNVLVFSNWYNGLFSDSKMSGIELIHHGVRTATNGDVRLNATPEQWDAIPAFKERRVDRENNSIEAFLTYSDYQFDFSIKAQSVKDGIKISVNLPTPVPAALAGKVGFNLEFLPASYFEKAFLMDSSSGLFPLYPTGPKEQNGIQQPTPLATGQALVLAPNDPYKRVNIQSASGELALFDGRNKAQNGWFVVRELLPSNQTGAVLEWTLTANAVDDWLRQPVIGHSQVGYHPLQQKRAIIELDKNDQQRGNASLLKVTANGKRQSVLSAKVQDWGQYKRYNYVSFDFSDVQEPGLYVLAYGDTETVPFRIDNDVYQNAWHPTLDVYFPVQMDHVLVNEAYRVWHGASHLDDALQAPINHEHFDLYAQGPSTDTAFQPGEHIPGLNIGGWYDAGDYDIRTQTQYRTVNNLVNVWEQFKPLRDTTRVSYDEKYVDLHVPDGKPDILQQIEHGTLALIAQHHAVGHAIAGIIVPDISQYTHLGDGLTMTDNLIYDANKTVLEADGVRSGKFDDRWAFTSKSSALNYGSIAALTAAGRALSGYNDVLAKECLSTAKRVWAEEQAKSPDLFRHGNTTGGPLEVERLKAAVELLISTSDKQYADYIQNNISDIQQRFGQLAALTVRAIPHMNKAFSQKIRQWALEYKQQQTEQMSANPFGVQITEGGWAGNGTIINNAVNHYYLHQAFPDIFDVQPVFQGLHYLYGTHPDSDISFVSSVGTQSKRVAYGMNRADYSFIAGGIVPGVLILKPDFPENKEDWPFLWGENEYVINLGANYIFLVHAADRLLQKQDEK
ncbi:glycoside hydrolase family 9 protein [Alteromonadaceae bacterium BrNp21-10]|nr:glycoside hydrolase family 9 protein [Alteromonadaceae bacterium BrNp21-10]